MSPESSGPGNFRCARASLNAQSMYSQRAPATRRVLPSRTGKDANAGFGVGAGSGSRARHQPNASVACTAARWLPIPGGSSTVPMVDDQPAPTRGA